MKNQEVAKESRLKVLELVYKAQTSHIGSLFSCADIFAVLFDKIDLGKDKFVLSAGWKAAMLYYHMWRKGLITQGELDSYCQPGSKWIGLSEPVHEFITIAGGSMGLGLPGAVGLALAKKIKKEPGIVYCLMSDGEQQIGTTWESAMIAAHHKLTNLVVIIDNNQLQAMGQVEDVLNIEPLATKWRTFGWQVQTTPGHDFDLLEEALTQPPLDMIQPRCIIADTVKGKGVSFMANDNQWHYRAPNKDEYEAAIKELNV